jgi:hypothetical protein
MIICAAIKLTMNNVAGTEQIICGLRHGDCLKTIAQLNSNWKNSSKIQGFITHTGEFLDRKEAFKHAKGVGQCNATQRYYWEDHGQEELYSEDLY